MVTELGVRRVTLRGQVIDEPAERVPCLAEERLVTLQVPARPDPRGPATLGGLFVLNGDSSGCQAGHRGQTTMNEHVPGHLESPVHLSD